MRILILTLTISEKCGLGRYSLDLIRALASENQLIIYTAIEDKKLNLDLRNCQFFYLFPGEYKIFRIMRPWLFLKYLGKILPKARKADLIHSFMDFPYSFLAVIIGKLTRKPVVATAHGTYSIMPFYNRRWKGLIEWTYRSLSRIICVSNFTKKEILKRTVIKNCEVINNGINLEKFRQKGIKPSTWLRPGKLPPFASGLRVACGKLRDGNRKGAVQTIGTEELIEPDGVKKDQKMILSVGMLKYRKGFHIALKAVAGVKQRYPNLKYYIVGRQDDKNYFEKLKTIVRDNNLEETVIFLENISDEELIKLYEQADLFLLTPVYTKGNFEGFGLVYLEAGIFGKPVIGSLGSGAEDAIIDQETGFLAPEGDIKATSEAIVRVLDDSLLAESLGKCGQKFAKEHDWERVAQKYQKIYRKLAI